MAQVEPGTVLVVDDNAENRALAQATLEDEGYTVRLATSGAEALAAFEREHVDCILLDIRMPGMDGIEACRRLRALPAGSDVPILFLTAQRDVDTFDRAREAGGDDYLTKPVRPSELIARVGAAAKLRRMALERRELYDVVRTQRDDLMRLQLQKEQLVAFLVHDLKNPVNAIELQAQRISRDPGVTARSRDAAARVQMETRALLRMITNLLDLSKADEGGLAPVRRPISLAELLAEVETAMLPRAREALITLSASAAGVALVADRDLLLRTIENLVDNAIRYAPENTAVSMTARSDGSGVEIRVADAGPGVPQELHARVFERFAQAEDGRARTSRGLGLAFCKLAVEAHGGRIWIEDGTPGAIFCLRIPHHG
ncbi:MAG TPA: hybrid sensor histidine kinase/response regulator [Kofleriaceae bacterium]|nr:hybrid sensor histidine kinase/response regulator [Kofleriaceae bacterium]